MFPNPLNINDIRKVEHIPPHFIRVTFDLRASKQDIINWIYENLHSRFYADNIEIMDSDTGRSTMKFVVSFEDHAEASYFSLFLPNINVN
jgi:hypothetical protein